MERSICLARGDTPPGWLQRMRGERRRQKLEYQLFGGKGRNITVVDALFWGAHECVKNSDVGGQVKILMTENLKSKSN